MTSDRIVEPLVHIIALTWLVLCLLAIDLPRAHAAAAAANPPSAQHRPGTLQALRPPKRARPLVAVLALNEGSETVDFLVPYGVLARSGLADVVAVAVAAGPVRLMPALRVLPDTTTADFDQRHPEGADYVIVPAMHDRADPRVLAWLRRQARGGATLVGVCAGSLVLAEAGLLRDRRATTHWFQVDEMKRIEPRVHYVPDARYVVDDGVVTTTGVSAALPVSLALVAAIGGTAKADALARELGAVDWTTAHASARFELTPGHVLAYSGNFVARWRHERVGIQVLPTLDGNASVATDEIAIAMVANAYASTHLVDVRTLGQDGSPVRMRAGLRLLPDGVAGRDAVDHLLPSTVSANPASALDRALAAIETRYDSDSADIVRLELEYEAP